MATLKQVGEPEYELTMNQEELDVLTFVLGQVAGPADGPRGTVAKISAALEIVRTYEMVRRRFLARVASDRGVLIIEDRLP
jgi:hypothetical protein